LRRIFKYNWVTLAAFREACATLNLHALMACQYIIHEYIQTTNDTYKQYFHDGTPHSVQFCGCP
jgi:hypothetical protein